MLLLTCKDCGKQGSVEDFDDNEDYCPYCGSRDIQQKEVDQADAESKYKGVL